MPSHPTPPPPQKNCSDLDGTPQPNRRDAGSAPGNGRLRALQDRGVLFCPASGRQYTSLRKLFAPVADRCVFLCENGAVVFAGDRVLKTPMPRDLALTIAWDLWNRSDGEGEVMLSGENTSYLMERGLGMLRRIREIGNNYRVITDPADIPEDILKVSVYLHKGVGDYVDRFVPRWQQANAAVAGPYWIDTTLANKGLGVRKICEAMDFSPGEVMAFGDNYNDVSMLDLVGQPYIMDTAAEPLRRRYPSHTPRPEGVMARLLGR